MPKRDLGTMVGDAAGGITPPPLRRGRGLEGMLTTPEPVDQATSPTVHEYNHLPVYPNTNPPTDRSTGKPKSTRVVASYKIDPLVKRDFARFVKHRNRDREPGEEEEIGAHVEAALKQYMAGYQDQAAGTQGTG